MAAVPSRVAELVETFDENVEAYRSQQYNETQLRREFIDPFFEELAAAKVLADKTQIQRQIDVTDKQIDKLVYQLYDLTEEEIKIIEEA